MPSKAVFVLFILFAGVLPQLADACSCIKLTDVQKYRRAQDVFVGTVLETRYVQVGNARDAFNDYIEAKVEVAEIFKGSPGRTIQVRDQIPTPGMCSSFLLSGVEYVFFVTPDGQVGMCGGTSPFQATIYDREEHLQKIYELRDKANK